MISQILSYIAASCNLVGVYLIGGKKRGGFLFFLVAGLLWSIIALSTGLHGLLLEAVPLAILNIIAYRKWGGGILTKGFSFGDYTLYQQRAYYRGWIDRTLHTAWKLPLDPSSREKIMQLKDNIDPPTIEDPGRLICADLQRDGIISRCNDKFACLIVMIRNLIQIWWGCSESSPENIEGLLIELDHVIEEWAREEVTGSINAGFKLEIK